MIQISNVTSYRSLRPGPEAIIQDHVLKRVSDVLTIKSFPHKIMVSMPIGAGLPDITIAAFQPELVQIAGINSSLANVLGYLRVVRCARLETIAHRLNQPEEQLNNHLNSLSQVGVIYNKGTSYFLANHWYAILPEVVTIEVKVSNWRHAVEQAARNMLFCHRSFIAIPSTIGERACSDARVRDLGIGVISVNNDGAIRIHRKARRSKPKVWAYYYKLAISLVNDKGGNSCALSSTDI